jgi:hypothetical protein
MVNKLNWSRITSPARHSTARNIRASATLIWPDGIGRAAVRATLAS